MSTAGDTKKKPNPHVHHRRRLLARFSRSGFGDFEEHNILELLLFYSIPRADTNPAAHALIDRFGSLYGVLSAPEKALTEVAGIGPASAAMLHAVGDAGRQSQLRRLASRPLSRYERLTMFAAVWFVGRAEETVALCLLDEADRLIEVRTLAERRAILPASYEEAIRAACAESGARRCILMHNHADGALRPSGEDLAVTARLWESLRADGIALLEHLIVCEFDVLPILNTSLGRVESPYLRPGEKPAEE